VTGARATSGASTDAALAGARVLVLGLGRFSGGLETVRFLAERGARVLVSDTAAREALGPSADEAERLGATLRFGAQDASLLADLDLVVANPAIPFDHEVLLEADRRGIPLTTETNLFLERVRAPVLGVTGTKGKSTTSALLAGIVEAAGRRVHFGGNVGRALVARVDQVQPSDVVVLELSSFQLHWTRRIRRSPALTLVTNLFPDHLDRHGTFAAYAEAKRAALDFQTRADVAVLPADDAAVREAGYLEAGAGRRVTYGAGGDYDLDGTKIVGPAGLALDVPTFPLWGAHNRRNLLAAAAAALEVERVGPDAVRAGAARATPLPHRLCPVAEIGGVLYVDDSNATNPQSTLRALEAVPRPAVVLVGGKDKGIDPAALLEALARGARAVVGIGTTGRDLVARLEGRVPAAYGGPGLEQAVRLAASFARPGDVVLLSPAYSSLDEHASFAARGAAFQRAVETLALGRGPAA
jgi:UDP-N-acetylmuramoylalanine--D-glutamate ligase